MIRCGRTPNRVDPPDRRSDCARVRSQHPRLRSRIRESRTPERREVAFDLFALDELQRLVRDIVAERTGERELQVIENLLGQVRRPYRPRPATPAFREAAAPSRTSAARRARSGRPAEAQRHGAGFAPPRECPCLISSPNPREAARQVTSPRVKNGPDRCANRHTVAPSPHVSIA
jgi:hypothetical protein